MKNILPLLAVLALLAGLAVANCAPPSLTPDPTATPSPVPTATPTPTPVPVTGVAFADASSSVVVGNDVTLAYVVSPLNAANQGVSFSSDATGVATVNSNGVVHGVSAGTANITITTTEGSFTDVCPVTVSASAILATAISIDATASVTAGSTVQLTKTLTPSNSTQSGDIVWSSDTTSVATVDTNGLVTGVVAGSAIITATVNGHSDTCTVTVNTATASAPTSSVATGMTVTNGSTITLTSPEGLSMRYVFGDDTVADPTSSNTQYSTAITINRNMCIKAYAEGNGTTHSDSPVATFTYYVNDTANLGFEPDTPSYRMNSTLSSGGFFFTTDGSSVTTASTVASNTDTTMHYSGTMSLKITNTLVAALSNWGADVGMSATYLGFAGIDGTGTGLLDTMPGTTACDATSTYDPSLTGIGTNKRRVNNAGTSVTYKVAVFIPTGSVLDRFGIILYDDAGGGVRLPLQSVTAGKWNQISWTVQGKALVGDANISATADSPAASSRAMMCTSASVTVDGTTTAGQAGAASGKSPSDPSRIRFVAFIASSTATGSVGTEVNYYLDSFTWQ